MRTKFLLATAILAVTVTVSHASITLSTVIVGNPGNANDPADGDSGTSGIQNYGAVPYTYAIGKYDVTLTQYTAFLNAVAATDTYGLYNPSMAATGNNFGQPTGAGIQRNGIGGSYTYSVIGNSGNNPVTLVSWYDAARFANWLCNGQPLGLQSVGTTETGAYTLNGATSGIITNNGTGSYWLPSENEWYKAAYYDPNKGGNGVGGYWTYATKSNSAPGNVIGGSANQANYHTHVYSVTQSNAIVNTQNYLTDVGAFTGSASAYGTFDQNGDVAQWNDAVISSLRGVRGGSWFDATQYLQSSARSHVDPTEEGFEFGFRIATIPEPTAGVSLILAGGLLLARRKRPAPL